MVRSLSSCTRFSCSVHNVHLNSRGAVLDVVVRTPSVFMTLSCDMHCMHTADLTPFDSLVEHAVHCVNNCAWSSPQVGQHAAFLTAIVEQEEHRTQERHLFEQLHNMHPAMTVWRTCSDASNVGNTSRSERLYSSKKSHDF